jgi:hypothetical protein
MSWCGSLRSPAPYVFCSVASPVTPLAHRPVTRQSFQIPQGRTCVGLFPFSWKTTLAVRNKRKSSAFNDPNQKAGNPGEGPVCSPLHGVSRKPARQYQQPIPPDRPHFLEKTPNNGEDGLERFELIRIRLTPFRKEFVVSPVRGVFSDSYPFRNPQTPLTGLTTNEVRLRAQSHSLLTLYPWETPPQRSYSREKGIRNFIKCYSRPANWRTCRRAD